MLFRDSKGRFSNGPLRPKFIDAHSQYDAGSGYTSTNEAPESFVALLDKHCPDQMFKRGGGIASGGEITFFVLLPRCEEIVVVDHSYSSLHAFYLKALWLADRGVKGFRQILNGELDWQQTVDQTMLEVLKVIPAPRYPNTYLNQVSTRGPWATEWNRVSDETLEVALSRLDKLTLVHGDLTDLPQFGKLDLCYVSNAMEHRSRLQRGPRLPDFEPLMVEDGVLLYTGESYDKEWVGNNYVDRVYSNWGAVEGAIQGPRTSWNHQLRRYRPQPAATESSTFTLAEVAS